MRIGRKVRLFVFLSCHVSLPSNVREMILVFTNGGNSFFDKDECMKYTVKRIRGLTATLAALVLCSAGIASAATTLKLNHSVLPTHGYHLGAVRFAELVK